MIAIRLLFIPNTFKRQADDSGHHRACVEGKFRRPVVPKQTNALCAAVPEADLFGSRSSLMKFVKTFVKLRVSSSLTRAPLGGGEYRPPYRIYSIAKKRWQISTRNFQYLPEHQFDVGNQNIRKICRKYFEKMAFS